MARYVKRKSKLCRLLEENRALWDHDGFSHHVRETFERVILCSIGALGAEVHRSAFTGETTTVNRTCKDRFCTSCGYSQTRRWLDEVASQFPEIPYAGIILTMPKVFWLILRKNKHLLPAIPVLGAGVIGDWARERHRAEIPILVVRHTFNPRIKFNVHLHILAGRTGPHLNGDRKVEGIYFPISVLRERWRQSLLDFLEQSVCNGSLRSVMSKRAILALISKYRTRWWVVLINQRCGKRQILDYICRYLRRPPIADYRIGEFGAGRVRFQYKDKKQENQVFIEEISLAEFISRLADQVQEKYRHGVRYFGLLAPKVKTRRLGVFWHLPGAPRPRRVRRLHWAELYRRSFGFDPLLDSLGNRMKWSHSLPAAQIPISRAP